jgi:hypothetical protein
MVAQYFVRDDLLPAVGSAVVLLLEAIRHAFDRALCVICSFLCFSLELIGLAFRLHLFIAGGFAKRVLSCTLCQVNFPAMFRSSSSGWESLGNPHFQRSSASLTLTGSIFG